MPRLPASHDPGRTNGCVVCCDRHDRSSWQCPTSAPGRRRDRYRCAGTPAFAGALPIDPSRLKGREFQRHTADRRPMQTPNPNSSRRSTLPASPLGYARPWRNSSTFPSRKRRSSPRSLSGDHRATYSTPERDRARVCDEAGWCSHGGPPPCRAPGRFHWQ